MTQNLKADIKMAHLESFFYGNGGFTKMLKIIGIALLGMIVLFVYSACVISGRCSREEEKRNEKIK